MKPTPNYLDKWELITNQLVGAFVAKYFTFADVSWVSDTVGDVLNINDYWFSLDRVVEAMRYNAPKKKMFDYYDLEMKAHEQGKKMDVNFKNYLKIK